MSDAVAALAALRADKCDIWREEKVQVGNITKSERRLKYAGVICRLSKTNVPALVQTTAAAGISTTYQVYFAPGQDVKAGDTLFVTRRGRMYECVAGDPFDYDLNTVVKVNVNKIT